MSQTQKAVLILGHIKLYKELPEVYKNKDEADYNIDGIEKCYRINFKRSIDNIFYAEANYNPELVEFLLSENWFMTFQQ